MSNHLFRILQSCLRLMTHRAASFTPMEMGANALCLGVLGAGHAFYALGTGTEEEIRIQHKYMMVRGGYTEFMVVDDKGCHRNVSNSLWYWKWDAVEEWERLRVGETRRVRMYGWRSPLWGLFPNIVGVMDATPKSHLK